MRKYLLNVLLGLDQWANSLIGGDPQETISSRAGRQREHRTWARVLCWGLDKLEPGHCANAEANYPKHLESDDSVLP